MTSADLVKSVGASDFNARQLKQILEPGTIVPAVNQFEMNLH